MTPDHSLTVTFTLKMRILDAEWAPSFEIELQLVKLDTVDVLESKLRDQEDEIAALRSENARLTSVLNAQCEEISAFHAESGAVATRGKRKRESVMTSVSAEVTLQDGEGVRWVSVKGNGVGELVELLPTGAIRVLKSCWIDVLITAVHGVEDAKSGHQTIRLYKGEHMVAVCHSPSTKKPTTSVLSCVLEVTAGDELKARIAGLTLVAQCSTLVIQQVGAKV